MIVAPPPRWTVMPLDRPSIQPFPIHKGRYDVRPGSQAFGRAALGMEAEEGHFRLDRTTPSYLRQNSRYAVPTLDRRSKWPMERMRKPS